MLDKNGSTDRDAVWCTASGGPKEACVRWGPYWRHLENTTELSMCGSDAAFIVKWIWPLVFSKPGRPNCLPADSVKALVNEHSNFCRVTHTHSAVLCPSVTIHGVLCQTTEVIQLIVGIDYSQHIVYTVSYKRIVFKGLGYCVSKIRILLYGSWDFIPNSELFLLFGLFHRSIVQSVHTRRHAWHSEDKTVTIGWYSRPESQSTSLRYSVNSIGWEFHRG